jgi:hypothetical protein
MSVFDDYLSLLAHHWRAVCARLCLSVSNPVGEISDGASGRLVRSIVTGA